MNRHDKHHVFQNHVPYSKIRYNLGGWGRRRAWAQEFQAAVDCDHVTTFHPEGHGKTLSHTQKTNKKPSTTNDTYLQQKSHNRTSVHVSQLAACHLGFKVWYKDDHVLPRCVHAFHCPLKWVPMATSTRWPPIRSPPDGNKKIPHQSLQRRQTDSKPASTAIQILLEGTLAPSIRPILILFIHF